MGKASARRVSLAVQESNREVEKGCLSLVVSLDAPGDVLQSMFLLARALAREITEQIEQIAKPKLV